MPESQETLSEELRDEEYRYAYAEDFLNTLVATQIKVLREQRELTQQELAELIGTKQAGISRLENVNYSAWKTQTLRKIARALGVRLRITFETFGTLLDDAARFSPQNLERPRFDDDPDIHEQSSATAQNSVAAASGSFANTGAIGGIEKRVQCADAAGMAHLPIEARSGGQIDGRQARAA